MTTDSSLTIQGVWALDNMDVGVGKNQRKRTDAEFLLFIAGSHYSAIRDFTQREPGDEPTESGKRSFMADAGTFEFDGAELVLHHMIAMFPVLGSMAFKCSTEGGDTLILEPQYDRMVLPGIDKVRPDDQGRMAYGDMAVRYVFRRLE